MERNERYLVVGLTSALLIVAAVGIPVVSGAGIPYLIAGWVTMIVCLIATVVGLEADPTGAARR